MNVTDVRYHQSYRPGALATLCAMQTSYYADKFDFGATYEARVAGDMGEFLARFDPARDLILIAQCGDEIVGGIVIDHTPEDRVYARLRWFIVASTVHGQGVGRTLLSKAMNFVREKKYDPVYLTTIDGLDAARHLYEEAGFQLTDEQQGKTWGASVTEQRYAYSAR